MEGGEGRAGREGREGMGGEGGLSKLQRAACLCSLGPAVICPSIAAPVAYVIQVFGVEVVAYSHSIFRDCLGGMGKGRS